jgi:hypothetical protein
MAMLGIGFGLGVLVGAASWLIVAVGSKPGAQTAPRQVSTPLKQGSSDAPDSRGRSSAKECSIRTINDVDHVKSRGENARLTEQARSASLSTVASRSSFDSIPTSITSVHRVVLRDSAASAYTKPLLVAQRMEDSRKDSYRLVTRE